MRFVDTPSVYLLAETGMVQTSPGSYPLRDMLGAVGAPDWETDAVSDGETLAEVAGRFCYRSFAPGLNPNVTRVREGSKDYIGNILGHGHGSVLEHASVSFAFLHVSRIATHELVRHRAGTAYSQESLRFVRLTDLMAYWPEVGFGEETMRKLWDSLPEDKREGLTRDEWAHQKSRWLKWQMARLYEEAEHIQKQIAEVLGLDAVKDFGIKKKVTSAMRRLVPDGLGTAIIFTANHRALRDIIQRRTDRHAEEEIRRLFAAVFELVASRYPAFYQDAAVSLVDGIPEVVFDNPRV